MSEKYLNKCSCFVIYQDWNFLITLVLYFINWFFIAILVNYYTNDFEKALLKYNKTLDFKDVDKIGLSVYTLYVILFSSHILISSSVTLCSVSTKVGI